MANQEKLELAVYQLLEALGENPDYNRDDLVPEDHLLRQRGYFIQLYLTIYNDFDFNNLKKQNEVI